MILKEILKIAIPAGIAVFVVWWYRDSIFGKKKNDDESKDEQTKMQAKAQLRESQPEDDSDSEDGEYRVVTDDYDLNTPPKTNIVVLPYQPDYYPTFAYPYVPQSMYYPPPLPYTRPFPNRRHHRRHHRR